MVVLGFVGYVVWGIRVYIQRQQIVPHPYALLVGSELAILLPTPDPSLAAFIVLAARHKSGHFQSTDYHDSDRRNVEQCLTHADVELAVKLLKELCYDISVVRAVNVENIQIQVNHVS